MENFDEKRKAVSKEDLRDGVDFIAQFSYELKKYPNRICTSTDETACARAIRNRLHDETDAKTRLEAFKASRMLGRCSLLMLGVWYALCYVVYFVSFAGDRVAGALVTLLSLVMFLAGGGVLFALYLGNGKLSALLPRKVSYNVVSERARDEKSAKRVFVVCDNHDATAGSAVRDFDVIHKIAVVVAPISAFVFVLFCVLKMAIGTNGDNMAAKISAFTIFPFVSGIFGIGAMTLHFSPRERLVRKNNGVSTAVAMATYAYFAEQPELMPEDAKIVYVSLGAENCGHQGSRAFVKAHPEFANATVLCIGEMRDGSFQIAESDDLRRVEFSLDVVASAHASAIEQGIGLCTLAHDNIIARLHLIHGFSSTAFAKNGTKSATILASGNSKQKQPSRDDMENAFALCVGTMQKLMALQDEKGEQNVLENVAPSVEIEIKDVESK